MIIAPGRSGGSCSRCSHRITVAGVLRSGGRAGGRGCRHMFGSFKKMAGYEPAADSAAAGGEAAAEPAAGLPPPPPSSHYGGVFAHASHRIVGVIALSSPTRALVSGGSKGELVIVGHRDGQQADDRRHVDRHGRGKKHRKPPVVSLGRPPRQQRCGSVPAGGGSGSDGDGNGISGLEALGLVGDGLDRRADPRGDEGRRPGPKERRHRLSLRFCCRSTKD